MEDPKPRHDANKVKVVLQFASSFILFAASLGILSVLEAHRCCLSIYLIHIASAIKDYYRTKGLTKK